MASIAPRSDLGPRVGCLMATMRGRETFAELSRRAFDAQTYPNRVLLQIGHRDGMTHGAKGNALVQMAKEAGCTYLVDWNDDDYQMPHSIEERVRELRDRGWPNRLGYRQLLWCDQPTGRMYLKDCSGQPRKWVFAVSSIRHIDVSLKYPLPDVSGVVDDTVWERRVVREFPAKVAPGYGPVIVMQHGGNSGPPLDTEKDLLYKLQLQDFMRNAELATEWLSA